MKDPYSWMPKKQNNFLMNVPAVAREEGARKVLGLLHLIIVLGLIEDSKGVKCLEVKNVWIKLTGSSGKLKKNPWKSFFWKSNQTSTVKMGHTMEAGSSQCFRCCMKFCTKRKCVQQMYYREKVVQMWFLSYLKRYYMLRVWKFCGFLKFDQNTWSLFPVK